MIRIHKPKTPPEKLATDGKQKRRSHCISYTRDPSAYETGAKKFEFDRNIYAHKTDKQALSQKLAEILDHVNYLHPFREGNGRTQREFIRLLALEKGLALNLNPPDNAFIYERYMQGTINSDVEILTNLIFELIVERSGK